MTAKPTCGQLLAWAAPTCPDGPWPIWRSNSSSWKGMAHDWMSWLTTEWRREGAEGELSTSGALPTLAAMAARRGSTCSYLSNRGLLTVKGSGATSLRQHSELIRSKASHNCRATVPTRARKLAGPACLVICSAGGSLGSRPPHAVKNAFCALCIFVTGLVSCYCRGTAGGTFRPGGALWVLGEALEAPTPEKAASSCPHT